MLSTQSILAERAERARLAKAGHIQPAKAQAVLDSWKRDKNLQVIPNIGDYRPEGWVLLNDLLVDATGWGRAGEPALTIPQFIRKVTAYNKARENYAFAIVEAGEMQVVIGVFKPDPRDFSHTGALTERELKQVRGS